MSLHLRFPLYAVPSSLTSKGTSELVVIFSIPLPITILFGTLNEKSTFLQLSANFNTVFFPAYITNVFPSLLYILPSIFLYFLSFDHTYIFFADIISVFTFFVLSCELNLTVPHSSGKGVSLLHELSELLPLSAYPFP